MQLDEPQARRPGQQQQQQPTPDVNAITVQCCVCGLMIPSNPTNMCVKCVQSHINITKDLLKEYILTYCPECDRYLQPPKLWTRAPLESRELMTICLKKVKGLSQFHLADAQFLWTEEHSKRIKLALTLQKELFQNAVVQQQFHIEFVVHWRQCDFCQKIATGQPQWDAVVQVRQKAEHKRTLLFLEQLILKHRMHENAISIEAHPEGMDFFFAHRSHGLGFVDFIHQNTPAQRRDAVQLVSHDSKSNTAVQHHTFSIEIAPVCREDLVCLPKAVCTALGGFGPMVLVHKVYSNIVFLDPRTLRAQQIEGALFWKNPFYSYANVKRMVSFFVLGVEPRGVTNGKLRLADITVCLEDEIGGDRQWTVASHLGALLKEGDLVKGYHVEALNPNNDFIGAYLNKENTSTLIPDVVLVHKHYENQITRRNRRMWNIRALDVIAGQGAGGQRAVQTRERDLEEFKDELERDAEFRKDVQLYYDPMSDAAHAAVKARAAAAAAASGDDGGGMMVKTGGTAAASSAPATGGGDHGEDDEDDEAMVDLAELIDDLQVSEQPVKRSRGQDEDGHSDDGNDGVCDEFSGPTNEAKRDAEKQLRKHQNTADE